MNAQDAGVGGTYENKKVTFIQHFVAKLRMYANDDNYGYKSGPEELDCITLIDAALQYAVNLVYPESGIRVDTRTGDYNGCLASIGFSRVFADPIAGWTKWDLLPGDILQCYDGSVYGNHMLTVVGVGSSGVSVVEAGGTGSSWGVTNYSQQISEHQFYDGYKDSIGYIYRLNGINSAIISSYFGTSSTGVGSDFIYGTIDSATAAASRKKASEIKGLTIQTKSTKYVPYSWSVETVEEEDTKTRNYVVHSDTDVITTTPLLTYPSLVETPFIRLTVGDYTFGSYTKSSTKNGALTEHTVTYPNFIQSLDVIKINGTVNQYTVKLLYKVEAGADPNLVDRIFSSISYGTVKIAYGDYSSPNFIYSENDVIIQSLTSDVNFAKSEISYTLKCTSNAISLAGATQAWPQKVNIKPSNVIKELMFDSGDIYGLKQVFPGMPDWDTVIKRGWIATDDKEVTIQPKTEIDVLSYINYLVTCMVPSTDSVSSTLHTATYRMGLFDDTLNEYGGQYFKIVKVSSDTSVVNSIDTYEVDVGYPNIEANGGSNVIDFKVTNDEAWKLVYQSAQDLQKQNYVYKIDENGNMYTEYTVGCTISSKDHETTAAQKNWWTNMTQFPITAELTIKGLVRASMLLKHVKINAFMYGQRHTSSGLYVVTKQQDQVSRGGYKTILTLLREAGDNDYISRLTTTRTTQSQAVVLKKNTNAEQTFATVIDKLGRTPEELNAAGIGGWESYTQDEDGNYVYTYYNASKLQQDITNDKSYILSTYGSRYKYSDSTSSGVTYTNSASSNTSTNSIEVANDGWTYFDQTCYDKTGHYCDDIGSILVHEWLGFGMNLDYPCYEIRQCWADNGQKSYNNTGIMAINGYPIAAFSAEFGKTGDYVAIKFENNQEIVFIKGDEQSSYDDNITTWGHNIDYSGRVNVIELCVAYSGECDFPGNDDEIGGDTAESNRRMNAAAAGGSRAIAYKNLGACPLLEGYL